MPSRSQYYFHAHLSAHETGTKDATVIPHLILLFSVLDGDRQF